MTPADAIATAFLRPFKYGPADCFSAALYASDLMTGGDSLDRAREIYADRRGAAIQRKQFRDWQSCALAYADRVGFGIADDDPRAGDLAVIDNSFAVCMGAAAQNWREHPLWAQKTPGGVQITEQRPAIVFRRKAAR